jgi:dsRNA-specific ribonuclease
MCNEYKTFHDVLVNDVMYGTGTGRSKGDAKEAAAYVAVDRMTAEQG